MGAVPIDTRPFGQLLPSAALAAPLGAFAVGVGALTYLTGGRASGTDVAVVLLGAALTSPVAAAVLLDRSPGHPLGLALCVPGLVPLLGALERGPSVRPLPSELLDPRAAPVVVLAAVLLVAVPLLLPDGRAGRGASRVAVAVGAVTAVALLAAALSTARVKPLLAGDLRPSPGAVLAVAPLLVVLAAGALAHVDQACAWRCATGADRDRRGWYLLGAAMLVPTATALIAWILVGAPPPAVSYALAGLLALAPMGVVGVVLVPDPPPLDRAVARALALGCGGVVLAVVYVAAFAAMAATDLPDRSAGAAVLTGVAALAALPAWLRCRTALETRLFGFGRQPAQALSGLQERLSAPNELAPEDAVTQWLAAAVRSPSAIVVPGVHPPDAVHNALVVPLLVGGAVVGHLVVAPRRTGERFGRRDRELLSQLAVPVALVVAAEGARRSLAASEGRVVRERERERRRVLDELHDTLGPALAGIGLQLAAARTRTARRRSDGDRVAEETGLLDSALAATSEARQVLRRLVSDLGDPASSPAVPLPAVLDELVTGWATAARDVGLVVTLTADAPCDDLPPPVRSAAVRIVGEALTNVVRHAAASRCSVSVRDAVDAGGRSWLVLVIADDGCGTVPAQPVGVGLRSLASRAEAVGGTVQVEARPGVGTTLTARLPGQGIGT